MAFDKLKVPYEYFGDNVVRKGNLRAKYDVILYPSTGNVDLSATSEGIPTGDPIPSYKKTDVTPNIATSPDQTDDTRGGLGQDGLRELVKFVDDGGLLIAFEERDGEDLPVAGGRDRRSHDRSARRSVRPGLGDQDAPHRQGEPRALRSTIRTPSARCSTSGVRCSDLGSSPINADDRAHGRRSRGGGPVRAAGRSQPMSAPARS